MNETASQPYQFPRAVPSGQGTNATSPGVPTSDANSDAAPFTPRDVSELAFTLTGKVEWEMYDLSGEWPSRDITKSIRAHIEAALRNCQMYPVEEQEYLHRVTDGARERWERTAARINEATS